MGLTLLGVDVAVRRGLDLVVLDIDGQLVEPPVRCGHDEFVAHIERLRPDLVAIDAPCSWACDGAKSRATERDLKSRGIGVYYTPCDEIAGARPFYGWVRYGMRAYDVCAAAGFSLFDGVTLEQGLVIEVFPHASTVTMLGHCYPTRRTSQKRGWRLSLLQARGVPTEQLRSMDAIDAAVAALTGVHALRGEWSAFGRSCEGVIVLPVRDPHDRYGPAPTLDQPS